MKSGDTTPISRRVSMFGNRYCVPGFGILGGTFNPVHRGHLLLAEGALRGLKLDRVLWVPAHLPPHKAVACHVSAFDRARMVELAIQGHPGFALSRVELERPPPSYTVDTVDLLRSRFHKAEWWLLLGSDTAREIPGWRSARRLRRLVRFAAIPRPDDPAGLSVPPFVQLLRVQTLPISSSSVRQRVRLGWEIHSCVPAAVARYIEEKGLYR